MNYKEHIIKWNKYYFQNKKNVSWGFDKEDSHISDFISFNNFSGKGKILDVGCGYGKNSKIFLDRKIDYTGIDIAKEPIEYAKNNIIGGNFILGDIISYDFKSKFDIIIDAGCFHVNNKQDGFKILLKYKNLISDNGIIFIRVFKSDFVSDKPMFIIDGKLPVWGYTNEELKKLFSDFFIIDKIILDEKYYDDDEVFYLYLRRK